ncbi:MAG: hypothetical protein KAH18_09275 [Psychromonas sp.]|nr:hypothetical protein [Psychromonas sp.]
MKLINSLKIILLFVSPFILAGCNVEGEMDSSNPTTRTRTFMIIPNDITGTWKLACSLTANGVYDYTQMLTYTGNKSELVSTFYARRSDSPRCSIAYYRIQITTDIVFGDMINKGTTDEHTQIDIILNNAIVTMLNDDFLNIINDQDKFYRMSLENGYFGAKITNWIKDQPRDVTNEYIQNNTNGFGATVLDIYQVLNNKLTFGDKVSNKDADGRPISIERTSPYTRQIGSVIYSTQKLQ